MIRVPLKWLEKHLSLPSLTPSEMAEKLTYLGLETQLVKKKNQFYLEVNPLPNRADLSCWWGIVQEIKTLFNCPAKSLNLPIKSKKKLFSVSVNTPHCLTFDLGLIKNVRVKESPVWLKEWLVVNQVSPVNNLVDSVNLVKLETGQSLQIYDYDVLAKKKRIVVEKAEINETVKSPSSGKLTTLTFDDLVVRFDREFVSLTEFNIEYKEKFSWTPQTKNILVQRAFFNPPHLEEPSWSLFPTSFISFPKTLSRITSLLGEEQESDLDSEVIFTYQKSSPAPHLIKISQIFLEKKIGQKFSPPQIEKIWKRLNFPYSKQGKVYSVAVPFWRLDVRIPEDLLEEWLRIYDYNQVVSGKSL